MFWVFVILWIQVLEEDCLVWFACNILLFPLLYLSPHIRRPLAVVFPPLAIVYRAISLSFAFMPHLPMFNIPYSLFFLSFYILLFSVPFLSRDRAVKYSKSVVVYMDGSFH